ncbi:MAG: hypothetical protein WCS94_22360, partial [Verrucomicrobiota bacterium]
GVKNRPLGQGDSAIAVVSKFEAGTFQISQLEAAQQSGAQTGMICFGKAESERRKVQAILVSVPLPPDEFLIKGITRVAVKLVMNALSTCTMVRLGRVMGNYMVWVVPSNLKLIDRATRYITKLTGLDYDAANALLFEIIEYVEPRMKADQEYPPVVGMAVVRAKHHFTNEQAESFLQSQ